MQTKKLTRYLHNWLTPHSIDDELHANAVVATENANNTDNSFIISLTSFWRHRPTRLFWLLQNFSAEESQDFFTCLDNEIERLPDSMRFNNYSKEQLQYLAKLAEQNGESYLTEQLKTQAIKENISPEIRQLRVPLVIKTSHDSANLPSVVFDTFQDFSTSTPVSHAQIFKEIRFIAIQQLFKQVFPGSAIQFAGLPLSVIGSKGFVTTGNSAELGFWVYLWLKHHQTDDYPSLCCTGQIDADTGKIYAVDNFSEKMQAFTQKNFAFFLVPEENLTTINYPSPRIIGFNHVDELNHWLLVNTGQAPQIRKVATWLKGDRQKPASKFFASFFSDSVSKFFNPLTSWKAGLKRQSLPVQLKKLFYLCKEFFLHLKPAGGNLHLYVPDYIWFAMLPWVMNDIHHLNARHAENLYMQVCEKFAESKPEVFLASRFIMTSQPEKLLKTKSFAHVRRRYPLILWLFFRDPAEMLHVFSCLRNLSVLEKLCLKTLCSELQEKIELYANASASLRADVDIMQKVVGLIDDDAVFNHGPLQIVRKRLVSLYRAYKNFADRAAINERSSYSDVSILCFKLIEIHLRNLAQKDDIEIEPLLKRLSDKNCSQTEVIPDALRRHPILSELIQELNHKHNIAKNRIPFTNNPLKEILNNLEGSARNRRWLPQPGLVFLQNLKRDWLSFDWAGLLNSFARDNHQSPAAELRLFCMAHWAGIISGSLRSADKIFKNKTDRKHRFMMAHIAGILDSDCMNVCEGIDPRRECVVAKIYDFTNTRDFLELFCYFLLPNNCQNCLRDDFIKMLNADDSEKKNESFMKRRAAKMMLAGLFEKKEASGYKIPLAIEWQQHLVNFSLNPNQTRRTIHALIPVYWQLLGKTIEADAALQKTRHQVNDSQFTVAYLGTFLNKLDVFRPIAWSQSMDEQIYNSLCLGYFSIKNPATLPGIITHNLEDMPNLREAFELLTDKDFF
ncbi:MAG: hypothetical protein EOM80_12695 [Erysipelotrichia bacterium]|nr:hypothetical protein [Erysipelotrichia bacterium]